jgi:tetratricopeptide (TPR) repeat protein
MRRTATSFLIFICLLVCAQAADAKETWTSVRSKNFFLVGNASEKEIRQVATRLEQFRDVFRQLFPSANLDSPVPTTVVVFKNDGAYKPFKPMAGGKIREDVAGYFQPGSDVNYITLTPPRSGAEDPYRTIYHEYVHLLVSNTLGAGAMPPWFNEGLAEYYSTFTVEDGRKVKLGDVITHHILLLRRTKMPPLKTLFELDNDSLHRNRSEARSIFYAQAWALVHYLIQSDNGARLPQMNKFLELTSAGRPVEQAFVEAFQTDLATMEKGLKNYVNGNSFQATLATFKTRLEFDAEMQSAPLTEAETDAYLGDLLLHTNRPEEAIERLRKALAADPKLAMAHASLGVAHVRRQRFDEARRHLREAVAADTRNYLAHYYYAYALSREGMNETERVLGYSPETAREMRASLERAAALKPDFPETYHLLAFLHLVTGEGLDEGIKLINRARQLAPGREGYAYVLAQLYMKKEDFDSALRTIEQLARDASDPQMRANADSLAADIRNYREQATRYKADRERAEREWAERASRPASASGNPPRLMRRGEESAPAGEGGKSEEEMVEEATMEAIRDALRRPAEGETRLLGRFTSIECDRQGVVFVIRAGDRTLRLSNKDLENVQFMSFVSETFNGSIGCGPYKGEGTVVVTYRPGAAGRAKTDGAAVALEFVPPKFRLEQ